MTKKLWKKGHKPWNKGLQGEEYLKHFKDGHPRGMLGKHHTEETKNIIVKYTKNHWKNIERREKQSKFMQNNNPMKNRRTRQKVRETNRKKYENGEYTSPSKGGHKTSTKIKIRNANMGNFPKLHNYYCELEKKILEEEGFRVIFMDKKPIPDLIAVKDGKVYAIEIQSKPNLKKEKNYENISCYDEVIWRYFDD